MSAQKNLWLCCGVLLMMAGCGQQNSPPGPVSGGNTMQIDGTTYNVTGPYAHENVSVFLIHTQTLQDDREFITLDEGLKEGVVKVTEKEQAQVSELEIDNQSERPLFLQEGDRLQGGKQDRTVITSIVVPAKSGKMP